MPSGNPATPATTVTLGQVPAALLALLPDVFARVRLSSRRVLETRLPAGVPRPVVLATALFAEGLSAPAQEEWVQRFRFVEQRGAWGPVTLAEEGHGRTWFEWRLVQTGPDEVLVLARDVSRAQNDERERGELERMLAAFGNVVPGILYVIDAEDLRVRFQSREVMRELGFDDAYQPPAGSPELRRLMHPEDLPAAAEFWSRLLASKDGEIIECDSRMLTAAGTYVTWRARALVLTRSNDGMPRLYGGLLGPPLSTITRAEPPPAPPPDPLAAPGTLHELRNLLQSITLFAAVLDPAAPGNTSVASLRDAVMSAFELTRREPTALTPELPKVEHECATVVRALLGPGGVTASPRGGFDLGTLEPDLVVEAAPELLDRALRQLFELASRSAPRARWRVEVTARGSASVDIRLRTEKPGRDAAPMRSLSTEGVRKAAADLRGTFLDERGPDRARGLALRLTRRLPRAPVDETEGAALRARPGETVLVVDDNPALRRYASEVLSLHGYEALGAADSAAAMGLLTSRQGVSLVLCDLVLRGAGGRTLVGAIRRGFPATAVIYTSSHPPTGADAEAVRETPLLEKPFTPETLARLVRRTIDEEARRRAMAHYPYGTTYAQRRTQVSVPDQPVLPSRPRTGTAET